MKNKILFYPGLGEKEKDYKLLSKKFDVAKIDWNTGKATSAKGYDIIVSFSLGVIFPLDYTQKHKVNKIILCSPTPFETLGKCKAKEVIFIVGEKEKFLHKIYKPLLKKNVRMLVVPKADHKITKNYLKTILSVI